jgi:7-cyano-7-deazaguanine synthase
MATQMEFPGLPEVKASDPAVVVLSGGQDSMTCLALARSRHEKVYATSFLYGQKHRRELLQAKVVTDRHSIPHALTDLSFFGEMVTSELTHDGGDTTQPHAYKEGLPASFVPNRNALFLTLAHACAQEQKAKYIYTGVCQTDYSGYPDCRQVFISALEEALNIGYQTDIRILTPMMDIDKAATFELAAKLGVLDEIIEDSHTCYNGDRSQRHDWGYGCGKCPACEIRSRGYYEYLSRAARSVPSPRTSDMSDIADAERSA